MYIGMVDQIQKVRYFGATSFSQNVISSNRRFAEMQFRRIVILPKQKIAESHLTESLHGRIVEFEKIHNAERRFPETSFARTSFCRTLNRPPAYTFVQYACRRAASKFGYSNFWSKFFYFFYFCWKSLILWPIDLQRFKKPGFFPV